MKKIYVAYHKDPSVVEKSSSGAMFTALSDAIFERGGIIIGGGYDYVTHQLKHIVCHTPEERDRCRGSKYIQSKLSSDVYDEIEDALYSGTLVLYFGTSCQVSAIKKYVAVKNIAADKLYTCDILCHGVGSPGIWRNFIKWIDPKSKVKYLTFKDKSRGWEHPRCIANTENRELSLRGYSWLYFSDSIMRPACYECKFVGVNREGDFTIGDFWKAKIKAPEIYNPRGTSFIMVNTDKGSNLFETVKNHLVYKEVSFDDIMQNNLQHPTRRPKHRPTVMKDFAKMSPELFFRKWEIILLADKIRSKLIR